MCSLISVRVTLRCLCVAGRSDSGDDDDFRMSADQDDDEEDEQLSPGEDLLYRSPPGRRQQRRHSGRYVRGPGHDRQTDRQTDRQKSVLLPCVCVSRYDDDDEEDEMGGREGVMYSVTAPKANKRLRACLNCKMIKTFEQVG